MDMAWWVAWMWAMVLGEAESRVIRFCRFCESSTVAGNGFLPVILEHCEALSVLQAVEKQSLCKQIWCKCFACRMMSILFWLWFSCRYCLLSFIRHCLLLQMVSDACRDVTTVALALLVASDSFWLLLRQLLSSDAWLGSMALLVASVLLCGFCRWCCFWCVVDDHTNDVASDSA